MRDSGLVCMASLIVAAYAIYMFCVGGDGVIFASVVGAVCLLAGVKYQNYLTRRELISDKNPGENAPIDEGEDID